MELLAILVATLAAGVGSVWLAALLLRVGVGAGRGPGPQHLLSLAAGALLSTAFMHLLPEAFESGIEPQWLFGVLLGGVVFFFLLDKAELWHHGHEHAAPTGHGDAGDAAAGGAAGRHGHDHHGHDHHAHDHHAHARPSGGWALVTGDSVHCFGDGVLIASAFMADLRLGVVAAVAVLAHEVPHHIGDLLVMRHSSGGRRMALLKVSLAGAVTALGGLAGYFLLERLEGMLPYFLVAAASSFVYVALADLVPQLQRHLSSRQTLVQVAWLLAGIMLVVVVSRLAHGAHGDHDHGHEHAHDHSHEAEHRDSAAAAPR